MKWNAEFTKSGRKLTSNLKPFVDQSSCCFETMYETLVVCPLVRASDSCLMLDYVRVINFRIIIRPRRSRSAAAYSHQTFPCTFCRSVGLSVCLSSALWKNVRSQPAAVRHHTSDGSTDEAGIGVWQSVHRKGYFWGRIWTAPL